MSEYPDIPDQYKARNDELINIIMESARDLMAIVQEVTPDGHIEIKNEHIEVFIQLKER